MDENELTIKDLIESTEAILCNSHSFGSDPELYSAVQGLLAIAQRLNERIDSHFSNSENGE